jgi:hypothetical protein
VPIFIGKKENVTAKTHTSFENDGTIVFYTLTVV